MPSVRNLISQFEGDAQKGKISSLKDEYARVIRPAFVKQYGKAYLSCELTVDKSDTTVNGFGAAGGLNPNGKADHGCVCVSLGVVLEPRGFLRTFAIAHETGHALVFTECNLYGVNVPPMYDDGAKKHEQMADLIAMRVLMRYLPEDARAIFLHGGQLAQWLGLLPTVDHPSGQDRAAALASLYTGGLGSFDGLFTSAAA
jgi:hypothetical protein